MHPEIAFSCITKLSKTEASKTGNPTEVDLGCKCN